jgi:glycosyltransferase involved in cell wall biosynthesis
LKALHKVRDRIHNPKIVIVGTGSPGVNIHRLIKQLGLADIVEQTGWVAADHYQHLIQLSDIAVDMRDMTAAETAHSVLRCLRVGKPAIVSARGTFLELPDDCCPKIELDERQEDTLGNLLAELSAHPEKLRQMEIAAQDYANEFLGLDLQAREFMSFIDEVIETTPGSGTVELLEPRPGRAKGMVAMLYKATRILVLVRSYGITDSLRRLRVILSNRFKAEDSGDL